MHMLHPALRPWAIACFQRPSRVPPVLLHRTIETFPLHLQDALMWMMLLVCALWHMEG